jgi:hypothetical protein
MPHAKGIKPVAQNRRAYHDFFVEETYECGLCLQGTEVKSIRQGRVNLKESFAMARGQEIGAFQLEPTPGVGVSIDEVTNRGISEVVFVIGGADGLSSVIVSRADQVVSFSRFTFPHQLFRLMLLEQIYRAFTIQRGEPYHRAGLPGFDGASSS